MDDDDARDRLTAEDLRARGSLKWTAMEADIAAWVAESDLGTAPVVTAALHATVDQGLLGYLPPGVRQEMATACARWHAERYGWQVPPERVHPVADVLEALRVAVEHFSRPGSPIILPTPAYMPFVTVPRAWGRDVIQVPMRTDGGRSELDLGALAAAFDAGGHLLVLTNPHNPTGRVMSAPELEAVADLVDSRRGRVFSDEIHAPLVYAGRRHVPYASVSPTAASHTLTATSASKAWNVPGLKCAQILLSNEADDAAWQEIDALVTHGAATPGVVAATAAYRDGAAWLEETLAYLDDNRRALAEILTEHAPDVVHRPPEGTYLAWLDLRPALRRLPQGTVRLTDRDRGERLGRWVRRRTGVAVVDGAACGAAGAGHLRLNLAMPRPMVREAALRLADCLTG